MPYATSIDGTAIAYQTQGDGIGLLLLAGQSNNHHWWDGVREDFDVARRTVTFDYRGTGDSDKPEEPYSIATFASDALAVLDALGAARVDVYGTSMGGRVAQHFAAIHPERVRALVLGCTSPGGRHAVERDASVTAALADTDARAAREALRAMMYTPQWLATHSGGEQTLGDAGMPPAAWRGHLLASRGHDAWDVLPDITAPTLVLHGEDDVLNPPANAPLLARHIPHARMELLPGARHAYFHEFRATAGPLVRDFLTAAH